MFTPHLPLTHLQPSSATRTPTQAPTHQPIHQLPRPLHPNPRLTVFAFYPSRDARREEDARPAPAAGMAARRGRCCGHALVGAALCCACAAGVAGLELDEVMAALPAEARARLSQQNAEVRAITDAILPYICPVPPAYLRCSWQVTAMTETIFREFDSDRDAQLSHDELQA